MGSNERRHRRTFAQAAFLLVTAVICYFWYQATLEARYESRHITARFASVDGKPIAEFKLELAATPDQRAKGMMFRRRDEVKEREGMLFVFPEDRAQRFWMKNTFVPLDMIFVDRKFEVVGIVHNAVPLSLDERGVDTPSRYVVELLGGTAQRVGLVEHARVVFDPLPPEVYR